MHDLFGQPTDSPAQRQALTPRAAVDPKARFVAVALNRGLTRAGDLQDVALTYLLEPGMPEPRIGQVVTAPLGRGQGNAAKAVSGIVTHIGGPELLADLAPNLDPARIKPLASVSPAILPPIHVELGRWLAEYYLCPLGMVYSTMLPAAVKRQVGQRAIEHVTPVELGAMETSQRDVLMAALAAATPATRKAWDRIKQVAAGEFPMSAKALCATTPGVSLPMVRRLVELGFMTATKVHIVTSAHDPLADLLVGQGDSAAPRPTPTAAQSQAVTAIGAALGSFSVHLLRGVTGSGKTEVYLRLIEKVLAKPTGTALVMVPEIALTPQTARRFLARFGTESVAVLHSALSSAQRHAQWSRAATGQARIVVGARSAVFAPLADLRIVVVDEEHDGSYKQDQLPRYHARDVAIKLAQLSGCPIVLGSATPSLESWYNAIPTAATPTQPQRPAKYVLHTLPARATAVAMPTVRLVDMKDERRQRSSGPNAKHDHSLHLLGPTLENALARTLTVGGQAMLLLNRRGYANYISCPDPACGWVMQCDHCDATTVYHRGAAGANGASAPASGGFVRCHHCLAEQLLPRACPVCAKKVNTFGMGTQRVEDELQRKFAQSHGLVIGQTLLRVDADTMTTGRDYFNALDRFASGEVRVLVGTQMIAKGLDFPNVQLVGVVNADTAINLPDFRAAERTFQLVAQVAGRAGRAGLPGLVIVQTMNPAQPSIRFAADHNFVGFATGELALRAKVMLPPVGRMARIVCRDTSHQKATDRAAALYQVIAAAAGFDAARPVDAGAVRLRGPMPCPISRIDDHYRVAIELYGATRGQIQGVLHTVRAQGLLKSDAETAIDIDPIALL